MKEKLIKLKDITKNVTALYVEDEQDLDKVYMNI